MTGLGDDQGAQAGTMLLALVIWSTIAICIANPLHKYPYVFLLDIGNEELEKTNTEQLRISVPGGSLAMKYPAMGEGDPISHVRVSGIDFGTDLKVNIVGGGPGYKYVVLMFMGNPGVTYDAVVTLETLQTDPSSTEMSSVNTNKIAGTDMLTANSYEVSEADSDGSDQNLIRDPQNMNQFKKTSKEVMQSTSTFYNYAKNEMSEGDEDKESENVSAEEQEVNDNGDDDDNEDDDESEDDKDEQEKKMLNNEEQRHSNEEKLESSAQDDAESFNEEEDVNENNEDESVRTKIYSGQNYDPFSDTPRAEHYRYSVNLNNADYAKSDSMYDKYHDSKPRFGLGFRVYPQSFIYNGPYQGNSDYNKKKPVEFERMFNEEKILNDSRFKDGSNDIDSDYLVAEY